MAVIITRPQPQANAWVHALQQAGVSAQAVALIEFAAPQDPSAVHEAQRRWLEWQAVMFVSAQAVAYFFESAPTPLPLGVTCWATGPGTRAALLSHGVPAQDIVSPDANAPQFDSEALWALVKAKVHRRAPVLIVRGQDAVQPPSAQGHGRDWLGQQLTSLGVPLSWVVAYERRVPQWTPTQYAQARQAIAAGDHWHFSSSQALAHLQQLLPELDVSRLPGWASHPRIAEKARAMGFARITPCAPSLEGLIAQCHQSGMIRIEP